MSEGNTNWGAINGAALLLSIAAGVICFYIDGSWLLAVGVPVTAFGAFIILSSFFRSTEQDRWGSSDYGAMVLFGFLFLTVGGALLVFNYSDNFVFPIVFVAVILALYLLMRAAAGRKA